MLNQCTLSTINNKSPKSNWKIPEFSLCNATGIAISVYHSQGSWWVLLFHCPSIKCILHFTAYQEKSVCWSSGYYAKHLGNWILRHLFDLLLWWFRLIYMMGLGCVCYGLHLMQYFFMAGFSVTFSILHFLGWHTDFLKKLNPTISHLLSGKRC